MGIKGIISTFNATSVRAALNTASTPAVPTAEAQSSTSASQLDSDSYKTAAQPNMFSSRTAMATPQASTSSVGARMYPYTLAATSSAPAPESPAGSDAFRGTLVHEMVHH